MSEQNEECVYCGENTVTERDHIPPKCLFPKPRPDNLITVPSCEDCNQDESDNDEYFRLVLALRHDVSEQEKVRDQLLPKIFRSLKHEDKEGLQKYFAGQLTTVESFSPSGDIYLGKRPGYQIDLERVESVLKRITRGLYWKEYGRRLPENYVPDSILTCNVNLLPHAITNWRVFNKLDPEFTEIGKTFAYYCQNASDDVNSTLWMYLFYNQVFVLVRTVQDKHI